MPLEKEQNNQPTNQAIISGKAPVWFASVAKEKSNNNKTISTWHSIDELPYWEENHLSISFSSDPHFPKQVW